MQWISVDYSLPARDEYVLVYVDLSDLARGRKCGNYEIGFFDKVAQEWRHMGDRNGIVSHWSFLPDAPE